MRWMVKLYPKAWRARYEDEFVALFNERKVGLGLALDVVAAVFPFALVIASLRPYLRGHSLPARAVITALMSGLVYFGCLLAAWT